MSDVEIVGLRARRRRFSAERLLGSLFAARHQVVIVAHANDLNRAAKHVFEILDDGRSKLDGPLLPRDMGRVEIANKPVLAAIEPDIHLVLEDDLQRALCRIGGKHVLFHDGHVGLDENSAVEPGNRRLQSQRIDQHRHAARRTAAGNRKGDACGLQSLHSRSRARRQHFLRSDERTVDVGQDKRDSRCGENGLYHARAPAFAPSTRACEPPPPRMNCSIALAKPSWRLLSVTKSAARCTCGLALPMAMLRPLRSNIATSLLPSPIAAISANGIPNSFAISVNATPLLASGWVMSR